MWVPLFYTVLVVKKSFFFFLCVFFRAPFMLVLTRRCNVLNPNKVGVEIIGGLSDPKRF